MSRSYRKPYATDGYGSNHRRWSKKEANQKVRRYNDTLANGMAYKKIFESWDIHDFDGFLMWHPYPIYRMYGGELHLMNTTPKWKAYRK